MAEKELSPEEQKLRIRRRLLKLAIYSIPAIATIRATEEAEANGPKPRDKRTTPHGPKRYPAGLS